MFCKNCGQPINKGAVFCGNCGTKIAGSRIDHNEDNIPEQVQQEEALPSAKTKRSGKKAEKVLLAVIAVMLLAGIGTGTALFINREKAEEDSPKEAYELQETETIEETEAEDNLIEAEEQLSENDHGMQQTPVEDVTNDEDEYILFDIKRGTIENYESALNTNDYQYYNSGIESFRFFYPAVLYSDVNYNEQETETPYGMNIKTIDFVGSAGSELTFSLYYYEDGMSIEEISEKIYNTEKAGLLDASDVIYGTFEDHGRIIVTGRTGDDLKMVYDLFYVDSEYVMQMKIIFPAYQGIEDKFQKDYVTECLYRLCGFSGSTANCRSYEAYKAESMDLETEIEQIRERYYSVQDRLNDMEIAGTDDVNVYIDEGNIYKIVAAKGTWGVDCTREYSFIDGRLYFAFVYDGSSERRFYFVDDMLIRYINENSEIYDLEDADFYTQFASEYQREAYRLLDEMGG